MAERRSAVFIDGGYFRVLLKEHFEEPRLDYRRFAEALIPNGSRLLRAYYYDCLPFVDYGAPEVDAAAQLRQDNVHGWFQRLRYEGLTVREGILQRYTAENGDVRERQKMVDVMLAIDLATLTLKRLIDHAVLIAGDSDFVPAVEMAKDEGVHVTVARFPGVQQGALFTSGDRYIDISRELIDRCLRPVLEGPGGAASESRFPARRPGRPPVPPVREPSPGAWEDD